MTDDDSNMRADRLGRSAESPAMMPWPGWRAALIRTATAMRTDRASLAAAGCAFWATLSLFPALSMLVLVYGLVLDPATVLPQLALLRGVLPEVAVDLIGQSIQLLVSHPPQQLGTGLAVSVAVTLWTAATGARALIGALNLAYRETETRGFLRFQAVALALTLGGVAAVAVSIGVIVLLPAGLSVIGALGLTRIDAERLLIARMTGHITLGLLVPALFAALYRYAPSRRHARWAWVMPGAVLAGLLWFAASLLVSRYLGSIARQDVTYGPLAAIAGVMLWMWASAYAVLLGAELNAALEMQTERDSCVGQARPIGTRGGGGGGC